MYNIDVEISVWNAIILTCKETKIANSWLNSMLLFYQIQVPWDLAFSLLTCFTKFVARLTISEVKADIILISKEGPYELGLYHCKVIVLCVVKLENCRIFTGRKQLLERMKADMSEWVARTKAKYKRKKGKYEWMKRKYMSEW